MPIYRLALLAVVNLILLVSCVEQRNAVGVNVIHSNQSLDDTSMQFYVADSGNDVTGDGSLELPWSSISHAVRAVSGRQETATLNLRAGTYQLADTLAIHDWSGNGEKSRLVIRSYEGENAVLDGSLITDFGAMVSIRNSEYVVLQNLEWTNLIGNKSGIHVTGESSNITIENNKVHGMHWTTDAAAARAPAPTDNLNPIVIVGDSVRPMRDISVLNNKVHDLTTGYSEAIKITGNIDGFLIEGNEVYDVSNIGIVAAGNYAWVGLDDASLNQARNGIINSNEVYRCISPVAASAGIYVDGARDISVTNNFSHHNTVGFSVGSEQVGKASMIVLSDNVSEDNVQAGFVVGTITPKSMVSGVKLVGNKMRGNYTKPAWGGAPIVVNKSKNISIQENAISSASQYMITVNAVSENLTLNNNAYVSTLVSASEAVFAWVGINNQNYTGFDTYKAETGQDADSSFNSIVDRILSWVRNSFKNILGR